MGQRERTDDGRFTETVTPEHVLDTLLATADPVATASEVADGLGCTREAVRVKLVGLNESGRVERKKVGGAAVVWWPTDEERTRGGSADPLFGLVGLFDGDDEAAARVRERSREFREEFDARMDSRRERATEAAPESESREER